MKTLTLVILALASTASHAAVYNLLWGTEDVSAGARCSIEAKKVIVLAASAEDCLKIGGVATHEIKRVSVPVKKK